MDNFERLPYTEMPMEICKSLRVGNLVFMSGIEAVDYRQGGRIPDTIEEQMEVVVHKMQDTLAQTGLSLANMVKHTIYMRQGAAHPHRVIELFHQECYKHAPELKDYPSTGTLVIVVGMVLDEFMIEIDATAALSEEK